MDDIIWAFDLDDKEFVPLINISDIIDPPVKIIRFSYLQDEKEFHDELMDDLRKFFGDK